MSQAVASMSLPEAAGPPGYTVAVRTLCEFTARGGDLDLRFTPSPTGTEGIEGHGAVTARRPAGYQREVPLAGDFDGLRVRGRADGWDPAAQRLEEIKTYRGDIAAIPNNHRALHWAQARIYGGLICRALDLPRVTLALVYFNIDTRAETVLTEVHDAPSLQVFFETQCRCFLAWATQEQAHRAARDAALAELAFPLPAFRAGQREMAAAVYRVARAGRCLMAQAPTGIGKTLGTLFPMLRAMPPATGKAAAPNSGLDKVLYLAAKTSGRQLALDALGLISASAARPPLRVLELVARDKACEHPDKACHGESCPLARGFWDRLPEARRGAVAMADGGDDSHGGHLLRKETVRALAQAHAVCPYYLAQELVRWADVVVGDYNYWFDASALLHALTVQEGWRVGLLVDEAHNLMDRARAMYSVELDPQALNRLRQVAPEGLRRPLDRLHRRWRDLARGQTSPYEAMDGLPEDFTGALRDAAARMDDFMASHSAELVQPDRVAAGAGDLQRLYFDLLHFLRLAETFGPHALFELRQDQAASVRPGRVPDVVPCIRNLVPAPYLQPRWAQARTAVLFSATLSPREWHADLLGLPEDTAWIDVPSPFHARQLSVRVVHEVSTRWRDRDASIAPIVALMARQYQATPGHYLAFFSSYDYLSRVAAELQRSCPHIPAWEQQRQMGEPARDAFLARFVPGGRGIGFAVLGGAFAEGIDLPGDRLLGAFVATLGLPQVNPVNEQMRQRMEARFPGRGYTYAYLYPGLQKVVQAAGRVIRTPQDEGVLYLIDDRFRYAQVQKLLPTWWRVQRP